MSLAFVISEETDWPWQLKTSEGVLLPRSQNRGMRSVAERVSFRCFGSGSSSNERGFSLFGWRALGDVCKSPLAASTH